MSTVLRLQQTRKTRPARLWPLAVCICAVAFGASAQERGAVIGYIESFSGESADYGIQRDSGAALEVRLRTQLRQGDQVEIRNAGETAVIRFTDGSREDVGPAAGWYGPYAERGSEASLLSNLLATVASTISDFRSRPVQTVATAVRSRGGPIVMGALFTDYPLVLVAGRRSLLFRWGGGDGPYRVRVTRMADGIAIVDADQIASQHFRSKPIDLDPGDHEVQISRGTGKFGFRFQVVTPDDLPEQIETPNMPAAVGDYLNAYALAVAADNLWVFESYQRLAALAEQGYEPAGLLMAELEEGEARYWEILTGSAEEESRSSEQAESGIPESGAEGDRPARRQTAKRV